jgi:transposase
MGRAVAITRQGVDPSDLRQAASRTRDGRVSCRLLAIAMVMEGASRAAAAAAGGMDRQTLRDWVHRFNAEGIAGLRDQPREGRPPALTGEQMQELKALVLAGPDPERDGVVRWRCFDLRGQIATRFKVEVHERTVSKLLHRLDLVRLQPRPYHPKKDADAQEIFKKTSCLFSFLSRFGVAASARSELRRGYSDGSEGRAVPEGAQRGGVRKPLRHGGEVPGCGDERALAEWL